jgi:hypothetical protein
MTQATASATQMVGGAPPRRRRRLLCHEWRWEIGSDAYQHGASLVNAGKDAHMSLWLRSPLGRAFALTCRLAFRTA